MIQVRYKGLFGNHLFQYSLGRILATELGMALAADPIEGLPHTADRVDGARYDSPEVVLSGHDLDLATLKSHRGPQRIVLDGWFQRHEYYRPHRDAILRWLEFDDAVPKPATRPQTVVHVRRNAYVTNGWALPFSFYEDALARLPAVGELWILTDDPRDPFMKHFGRWKPRFTGGTQLADLRFMAAARQLVMSQSTYSWWASFLGEQDLVICPEPDFGVWAINGTAGDASLIERDRFVCVPCANPYRPTLREAAYQKRRDAWAAFARTVRRAIPIPTLRRS